MRFFITQHAMLFNAIPAASKHKLLLQVADGEEVGKALDTGDQVEFSVLINRKLGTSVAEGVKLLCKAEDKRELGQVTETCGQL